MPFSTIATFRRLQTHDWKTQGRTKRPAFELNVGTLKRENSGRLREAINEFLSLVEVLDFDRASARSAAAVRARLEKLGQPIGAMDMLIAGHALSIGATLVTNNVREFSRVEGLAIENWAG